MAKTMSKAKEKVIKKLEEMDKYQKLSQTLHKESDRMAEFKGKEKDNAKIKKIKDKLNKK